ncbi:Protein of unknown function [Lactobacillus helveticus CIRM-BIA 951]|uniref:Uncharacterized protein n=1 Tax=Lactobacillus helveticus CIRM-BIA 951 TaxID=1226334 RepID=U6F2J2_LACHE|nr:Protein of unknown function [Lactobacillus helveticus CIRM-BIA 951]
MAIHNGRVVIPMLMQLMQILIKMLPGY